MSSWWIYQSQLRGCCPPAAARQAVPKRPAWLSEASSIHTFPLLHKRRGCVTGLDCQAKMPVPGKQKSQDTTSKMASRAVATPSVTSVASPVFLTSALAAFSFVTWDVFGGPHWLVDHVDLPAHQWVVGSISAEARQFAAGWVLSDSWIASGIVAWWLCGATLVKQSGAKGAYLLSTAIAAYFLGGGFLLSGDVLLVDFIKHVFQRLRPSTLHRTYSFPSGHTTAGVFIIGVLLFVLLPLCLRPQMRKAQRVDAPPMRSLERFAELTARGRYPIWLAAGLTTGAGRVLADAHWVTDTLAGASLGAALVSLTAMASNKRT